MTFLFMLILHSKKFYPSTHFFILPNLIYVSFIGMNIFFLFSSQNEKQQQIHNMTLYIHSNTSQPHRPRLFRRESEQTDRHGHNEHCIHSSHIHL